MRDYGKVSPQFWTGATGKALRRDPDAQRVAFYLMTSPHANMIGVYHLPVVYVANDVGLPLEGASEALARLSKAGFCTYSEGSEWVFVHNFAEHQVGEALKSGDNRLLGIVRELAKVADPALQRAFWDRYAVAYGLPPLAPSKDPASPLEAPPKPEAVAVAVAVTEAGKSARAPVGDAPPADQPKAKRKRASGSESTFDEWYASIPEGEEVIRDDDPICDDFDALKIPNEWRTLAWAAFEQKYRGQPKRYTDWRAVYRRAVREDWLKVWRALPDGNLVLTTVGEQLRRKLAA